MIITSWGSQPAHSSHHTSAPSCRNTVLVHGPPPLPTPTSPHTVEKKKKRKKSSPGLVMFPLARAPSLRYKAIPQPPLPTAPTPHLAAGNSPSKWGCTVSLWVPLQVIYFDGGFFFLSLFFKGIPFSHKKKKCHVECWDWREALLLPLSAAPCPPRTNLPSSPKQKLTRGIQLVNLTFGTLPAVCSAGGEPRSLPPEEERVGKWVSEAIDYEPRTDIRETSGLHYAPWWDTGPCSSQQAVTGRTMYRHMLHGL